MGLFWRNSAWLQQEPVKAVGPQRQGVRRAVDIGKFRAAKHLDRSHTAVLTQIKIHMLRIARQVRDDQHPLILEFAHERQHLAITRAEEAQRSASERPYPFALRQCALHPPQERVRIVLLCLNVHRLIVILRIDDYWQI